MSKKLVGSCAVPPKEPESFEEALTLAALDAARVSGAFVPATAFWSSETQTVIDLENGDQYVLHITATRIPHAPKPTQPPPR